MTLTPDGPRFKGQLVSWETLSEELATVQNPTSCFLAMDVSTLELTLQQWQDAQSHAIHLVEELQFDHFSDMGLKR